MDKNTIYTREELEKKLTEKERIFCHEYIIDWNGARAARKAGYSENSAKEIAHTILTKVHIKQYIEFIKNDIEKEAGLSKLKVLLEQKKIAFSSISHLHETWIKRVEFEELEQSKKDCIQEIETKIKIEYEYNQESERKEPIEVEYVKIKLFDKQKALEAISKMMGYNEIEKHDHSINVNGLNLELKEMSTNELKERLNISKKLEDEAK